MTMADILATVALVERDHNGDTMVVWNYPGTSGAMDAHILKRCLLEMEKDSTRFAVTSSTTTAMGLLTKKTASKTIRPPANDPRRF